VNLPWGQTLRLSQAPREPLELHIEPDAEGRAQLARDLGLEGISTLTADLVIRAWLDGAELTGRFDATVAQICGVSLEVFEQAVGGEIAIRVVPAGSPLAVSSHSGELELDPDAEEPPDVLEGEEIDVSGYIAEYLALEIDPFPRKPGAVFDYAPSTEVDGPFAGLRKLKDLG
jgi:uncharacterized metal-binding protein YceD (DUF177 family)